MNHPAEGFARAGRKSPRQRLLRSLGLLVGFLIVLHPDWAAATSVAVEAAEQRPISRQLELTGTVTSPQVARISTSVGGLVEAVSVDGGDRVDRGGNLVRLDRELAQWELRSARARSREAREQLADARRRLAEGRRLVKDHSISESEVLSLEAEVRIDAAVLERLEAEERHQAERLQRHSVSAPFSGVVSRKLTAPGEWIDPGTAVVELVALNGLRLDFQAEQTYFPRISTGTEVVVRLDALDKRALDGHVTAVIPVSDPQARTFTVRVHLDDNDVPMTPGMSARATVRLDTGREAVVIARDALIRYPDGRVTVWVLDRDDGQALVRERQVETGLTFDGRVEIRSGLRPGENVVVKGNEALQQNQPVDVLGK